VSRRIRGGVALRIAAAAILVAGVALLILAAGVIVVGSQSFAALMASHGISTASSDAMFQSSVVQVVLVAASVAVVAAIALASVIAARLAMPLREIGAAARRIAEGHYESRIDRRGPEEIVSLADSFNQMAASLQGQERMRREFIANAAHELRTPLTNLKCYLEALRDGVIPPDRATFESLREETERLVRRSRGLDTLADGDAAGPPAPVDVDLALAIRSAVELIQPAARTSGLEITLAVPAQLPARGNPDQLAQILGNLLQNAVRYGAPGGQVAIRAEPRPADILVSVTTSGDGIPADALPHVFERFYRVEKSRDRQRGGAGIGLSIVKQLVEGHGGTVGAESAGGVTRFWFSLPA
jgi:two-component system, OmpR family, sensor histidine kinase BaeS